MIALSARLPTAAVPVGSYPLSPVKRPPVSAGGRLFFRSRVSARVAAQRRQTCAMTQRRSKAQGKAAKRHGCMSAPVPLPEAGHAALAANPCVSGLPDKTDFGERLPDGGAWAEQKALKPIRTRQNAINRDYLCLGSQMQRKCRYGRLNGPTRPSPSISQGRGPAVPDSRPPHPS